MRADSANGQARHEDHGEAGAPPATSEHRERSTFLSFEEVLAVAVADCESVAEGLREMQAAGEDERRRLALSSLEHRERELCEVLVAYRRQAPDSLLRMQVQYVAGEPLELSARPGPRLDVPDAIAWAVSIHESLERILASLASKAVSESEQQAFEALAQVIGASKVQLARVASEVHDL